MSWRNYLRLGIILSATGVIVLCHAVFTTTGHLSPRADFIIGIVLVVLGVPPLVIAARKKSREGPKGLT
jgi:uncharacterized membrane protein HdeD (DUF308 family)